MKFSQNEDEFNFYTQIVAEGYNFVYPKIPIFLLDRDASEPDDILNESESKVYKKVEYISGHANWDPTIHDLGFYGIEDTQDVIATFSSYDLLNKLDLDDLEEIVGAILLLTNDRDRPLERYKVRTVYQKPEDTINWMAGNLDVAFTLDLEQPNTFDPEGAAPIWDISIPETTFLHNDQEVALYQSMVLEGYELTCPDIPILLLDRDATEVDPILNETEKYKYKDPISIPGHIQWQPTVFNLAKYGIETEQEVLLTFSDLAFKNKGIKIDSDLVGSIVILNLDKTGKRNEYEILSVHKQPEDSFSVHGDIFNVAITVNLKNPHSLDDPMTVTDGELDYPW